MKYILLGLFFSITIQSCGLSSSDKKQIEFNIKMHNDRALLNYRIDSIREISRLQSEAILTKRPLTTEYRDLNMSLFNSKYNKPYDIKKDRFLTLDSYLQYCRANGFDEKEYIKIMDR